MCELYNYACVLLTHLVFTVDPDSGNQCGGTPVIVTGVAIQEQDSLYCLFGESPVEGIYIDSTTFLCVSPRLDRPGLVRVRVVLNGTQVGPFDYFFSGKQIKKLIYNAVHSLLLFINELCTVMYTASFSKKASPHMLSLPCRSDYVGTNNRTFMMKDITVNQLRT